MTKYRSPVHLYQFNKFNATTHLLSGFIPVIHIFNTNYTEIYIQYLLCKSKISLLHNKQQ